MIAGSARVRARLLLAAAVVAVGITGCGLPMAGQPTASSQRVGTAAEAQGALAFDPCADLPDAVVRQAGFNPVTRERQPASGENIVACRFSSSDTALVIATSDTPFELFRDRYTGMYEGLDVGKRPAVIVRTAGANDPCRLAMKTATGVVLLQTTISVSAKEWGMDRCARIRDIATAIEPSIRMP